MNERDLSVTLQDAVKQKLDQFLRQQPTGDAVSLDWMERLATHLLQELAHACFAAWVSYLERMIRTVALPCPVCGHARKMKSRPRHPMQINVLGLQISVPKLYLECGHCDAPGVSITRVLTGLHHNDASLELRLIAAFSAAEHSYGRASRDLLAHHGQAVERTAVRRMALQVEEQAKTYVEQERAAALDRVSGEARISGVERLMLQGDGGSVRTGKLVPCEPGDAGYGKMTPKTGKARRKRETEKREIITMDVREPGQMEPTALDVVVPCEAEAGERARRMLALASRSGLGDNTQMLGLGDLGSNLPQSFDEAFAGYNALYSGDWKHVCNYVENASSVLEGLDADAWQESMKDAIWNRSRDARDELLRQAQLHRVQPLPTGLSVCPVHALKSYVCNNWHRMHAAHFKAMEVDWVSARAEAQVRERTRRRFEGPGAWSQKNLEGKATLRALIDEGSWEPFRQWCRKQVMHRFSRELVERLEKAVAEGRLNQKQAAAFVQGTDDGRLARAQAA